MPAKSPLELVPQRKPRDDAYNQKMNDYYAKRKALLDSKPSKYLEPEWNALTKEIQQFREGYEPAKIYSPREYLLDNDIDEFQIDQVRDDVSLEDVYNAVKNGDDFYEYASVNGNGFDSAVREKIFDGISRNLGVDYDDIYNAWLGRGKPIKQNPNPKYIVDNGNPQTRIKNNVKKIEQYAGDQLTAQELQSRNLLKKYYAGEFDLESLHNQLLKVHGGDIKSAFNWLVENARR